MAEESLSRSSAHGNAGAVLLIWHDVTPGNGPAVHEWYTLEHHQERLAIDGFLSASRWNRLSGNAGEFLGLYELRDANVLHGEAYARRLAHPTPWTRSIMPRFRGMHRTPADVLMKKRRGRGNYLTLLAGTQAEDAPSLETIVAIAGHAWATAVSAIAVLNGEAAAGGPSTIECGLRGGKDASVTWAILVEAATARHCERLSARLDRLPLAEYRGTYENVYYATRKFDKDDH